MRLTFVMITSLAQYFCMYFLNYTSKDFINESMYVCVVGNDEFKMKLEISFDFVYTRENILKNTDKWIVEIKSQVNILKEQY